jgi:putative transposase
VKPVAEALGVSRPHLITTLGQDPTERGPYDKADDEALLARIEPIIKKRATYGYRRVTAMLNEQPGHDPVNHKRVYRVMKQAELLLPKYSSKPERPHNGKVITLKSDLRWCSDCFEIRCWNGEKVFVTFSLDCCDREAIAWRGQTAHFCGQDIQDLMAMTIDARFEATKTAHPVEWLSDNGPPYTADATRAFGRTHGLLVRNTPSYSPESNGMAEAFVKTFKRDYVYLADISDAETVLRQLDGWFHDYNENAPHKGLKMRSPRQFRRAQQD